MQFIVNASLDFCTVCFGLMLAEDVGVQGLWPGEVAQ
jgi:hypothetical protein